MATTTYSSLYDSSGNPIQGRPKSDNISADNSELLTGVSYATTDLDTAADAKYLIPVRSGKVIEYIDLGEWTELDTGGGNALDMDLVLRYTNSAGTVVDTVIGNMGNFFTAAQTAGAVFRVWVNLRVPDNPLALAHIITYVNTAASTANAGTGNIYARIR